jgi:hypothetical protein
MYPPSCPLDAQANDDHKLLGGGSHTDIISIRTNAVSYLGSGE